MNPAYCPQSPHQKNLHAVYPHERWETDDLVYGHCAHCHKEVRGKLNPPGPWTAVQYIIEEDPI